MPTSYSYKQNPTSGYLPIKTHGNAGKNDYKKFAKLGETKGSTGKQQHSGPKPIGLNSNNSKGLDFEETKLKALIISLIGGARHFSNGGGIPQAFKPKFKSNFKPGPSWKAASDHLEFWHRGGLVNQGTARSNNYSLRTEAFWPGYASHLLQAVQSDFRSELISGVQTRLQNKIIGPPNWECNGVTGDCKFDYKNGVYTNSDLLDGGLFYALGAFDMTVRVWVRLVQRITFGVPYSGSKLKDTNPLFMPKNDSLEFEFVAASLQIEDKYDWHKGAVVELLGSIIKDDTFANAEPRIGRPYFMTSTELFLFGVSGSQEVVDAKKHKAFANFVLNY